MKHHGFIPPKLYSWKPPQTEHTEVHLLLSEPRLLNHELLAADKQIKVHFNQNLDEKKPGLSPASPILQANLAHKLSG